MTTTTLSSGSRRPSRPTMRRSRTGSTQPSRLGRRITPNFATELAEFFALQHEIHHLAAPIRGPEPMQAILRQDRSGRRPGDGCTPDSGRLSLGDYELLDEIARGGVGIVYRARQRRLNRQVAVKVLRDGPYATPADAGGSATRPRRLRSLDHPQHRADLRGWRGSGLQLLQHEADRGAGAWRTGPRSAPRSPRAPPG